MKILQIIPGTSNFYCGGCIRDTALFKAIKRLGHDIVLQPLYLPIFTDEPDMDNQSTIFFGGINMYLQQKTNFFQKTPRWIDRVFDSPKLLNFSANLAGMTNAKELGAMTVSMLQGDNGRQAKEYLRFTNWLQQETKPDVIILSNGMLLGLAHAIKQVIDIPIVCTLQGEDSFLDTLPEPYRSEAWRIFAEQTHCADALIPVSQYYAKVMRARLNLDPQKCIAIQNGISLDGFGEPGPIPNPPVLGYLARMCKEKGLDFLVEAFIQLKLRPEFQFLKLKIAGTVTKADEIFIKCIKTRLEERRLLQEVDFYPNVTREEKIQFLQSLTVLSVPAVYGESFGLYVIEAMAAGTPVVQPRHGGFEEILQQTNGGVLSDPADFNSYIKALAELLANPAEARRLGIAGREKVQEYFTVERMARDVVQVLESVQKRSPEH